jgi:uncharacterized surface protein with fasciclin (FAS1) repeats
MKISFLKYAFLFLFSASMISCDKEGNAINAPTLDAFIKADANLTMFSKALDKAGLESFVKGPGPFTWFAPTNDAFAAASITEDSLNRMTQGQANYLILYHLVNSSLNAENLIAVNSAPRTSQLGAANQLYYGSVAGDTYINGFKIVSRDNLVSNGYVHKIDRILVPPVIQGNIQRILTTTGQHTLFIQALMRATVGTTALWTSLGTASVFTVFAPTDAAMTAAGYTSASIAATAPATLSTAMRYNYILNLRMFTNDLIRPSLPATAAGSSFFITSSDNGTKVKGRNNPTAANIIRPNILGTNGVVHITDAVLRH